MNETIIKERGIMFSSDMVRAILDGRKTMTRRLLNPQPTRMGSHGGSWVWKDCTWTDGPPYCPIIDMNIPIDFCPHGKIGDVLYVKEAWKIIGTYPDKHQVQFDYIAGGRHFADNVPDFGKYLLAHHKNRPSMFMPRWASRIDLEITGVKVERLLDISDADVLAEGRPTREALRESWNGIHGDGAWESNPWCWCIGFKRVK